MVTAKARVTSTEKLSKDILTAFNRHDLAAVAAYYALDAVVHDPAYLEPLRGKDAIRKDIQDFWTAFSDIQLKARTTLSNNTTIAMELEGHGTHKGPLVTPQGTIQATNKRVEMRMAIFSRVNSRGLIVEEHRYMDMAGFATQLEDVSPPSYHEDLE